MPKQQVKKKGGPREEGNMGKRDSGKRLGLKKKGEDGKMQGAGEMVTTGRMATRSLARDLLEASINARRDLMSSPEYKDFEKWAKKFKKVYLTDDERIERFKIWRAKKQWVEAQNSVDKPLVPTFGLTFFSDLTPPEFSKYLLTNKAPDPYKGFLRTPHFYNSEYGKEVAAEEVAFDQWVAKHNRVYGSTCEQKDSFAFYFQNKKSIDSIRKRYPGCYLDYPDDLDIKMDQHISGLMLQNLLNGSAPTLSNKALDPYKTYLRTPQFYDSKYGKEVAEEEAAFDKWVEKHKKNYDHKERDDKFAAYFQNKRMIDAIRKQYPGSYLAFPDELDIKMDQAFCRRMLLNFLNGNAPNN